MLAIEKINGKRSVRTSSAADAKILSRTGVVKNLFETWS